MSLRPQPSATQSRYWPARHETLTIREDRTSRSASGLRAFVASITCHAVDVLSGAHGSRVASGSWEHSVAQTPARNATHPPDTPRRDTPPALRSSADAALRAQSPTAALIAKADGLIQPNAIRARRCILCGRPLRAGQHMLRVQDTTVHARCTTIG
jgi:hypothetical protein